MEFESSAVIRVTEADIYQENQLVLEGIDFKIDKGEFVYLVGRTGSGKSSLLKTLYADLPFENGEIEVAGFGIKNIKSNDMEAVCHVGFGCRHSSTS